MITFPFELGDTWNLSLFVTAIVPGGGNPFPALSGNVPVPSTSAILQEDGFFILQEDGSSILPET